MSKRVNISIPDTLAKALGQYPYLKLSKICQEALSLAVTKERIKEEIALKLHPWLRNENE